MRCPHMRHVVLADTGADAPIVLWGGPAQASGFGSGSGVSLVESPVCTVPQLGPGMLPAE